MTDLKKMVRPFATLFVFALVIALIGRLGLFIAASNGILAFDYISASNVPILDVICSILTGSAFVSFLFAAGLALCISTAGSVLYSVLTAKLQVKPRASSAFLCGWATALVALICLVIVVLGILSAVQVGSMSSKLPALPVIIVGVVVFAAFLGTLLGAASLIVCACIARYKAGHSLGVSLVVACLICGCVVMVLTLGTFGALNTTEINLGALLGWFAADIVVNLVILFGANTYIAKVSKAQKPNPARQERGLKPQAV